MKRKLKPNQQNLDQARKLANARKPPGAIGYLIETSIVFSIFGILKYVLGVSIFWLLTIGIFWIIYMFICFFNEAAGASRLATHQLPQQESEPLEYYQYRTNLGKKLWPLSYLIFFIFGLPVLTFLIIVIYRAINTIP